jgi:hypothetical protein
MAGLIVEWGQEPKPDQVTIIARNKALAEQARAASADWASPTGPRPDDKEITLRPGAKTYAGIPEKRNVPISYKATGPYAEPWAPPVGGKWVPGPSGVERFVPDKHQARST